MSRQGTTSKERVGTLKASSNHAALWQCEGCGLWWCSQAEIEPTTFMLDISTDLLEELGWDNFRGWRLGGTPYVATCDDCHQVSDAPLLGGAPTGGQLRV